MNIQEAYNKGLNDGEQPVLNALKDIINTGKTNPEVHPNPELKLVLELLNEMGDYYHKHAFRLNLHGKTVKKRLNKMKETLANFKL